MLKYGILNSREKQDTGSPDYLLYANINKTFHIGIFSQLKFGFFKFSLNAVYQVQAWGHRIIIENTSRSYIEINNNRKELTRSNDALGQNQQNHKRIME